MDIHLRDLRFFEAIADLGHMGQAAEQLGRSQPALSKCVKRLEDAIGSSLFEREGRGICLTPAGKMLREQARVLRGTADGVLREVRNFAQGRAGHVNIGSGPIAADQLLPELARLVLKDGDPITISIVIGPSWELHDRLRSGKIDILIGLTAEADPEFRSLPIIEDVVVVAARREHPIFKEKRISMKSLLRHSWALPSTNIPSRQWLDATFSSHGLAKPRVQIEAGSIPLLPRMIAHNDMLSFVSRHTLALSKASELREVALAATTLRRKLGVTSLRSGVLTPPAHRVMELLRNEGKSIFAQALRGD
ncbi:LysR family transcriptional regulator [Ottowia caeni]|uniref:LysR family transcriptional regulator n=1 Tax=Ottowia caeni TaxID=2870339 RepID=UPI001E5E90DA|nr:LysR family transcriptional regulator [Ottowia caeni]